MNLFERDWKDTGGIGYGRGFGGKGNGWDVNYVNTVIMY